MRCDEMFFLFQVDLADSVIVGEGTKQEPKFSKEEINTIINKLEIAKDKIEDVQNYLSNPNIQERFLPLLKAIQEGRPVSAKELGEFSSYLYREEGKNLSEEVKNALSKGLEDYALKSGLNTSTISVNDVSLADKICDGVSKGTNFSHFYFNVVSPRNIDNLAKIIRNNGLYGFMFNYSKQSHQSEKDFDKMYVFIGQHLSWLKGKNEELYYEAISQIDKAGKEIFGERWSKKAEKLHDRIQYELIKSGDKKAAEAFSSYLEKFYGRDYLAQRMNDVADRFAQEGNTKALKTLMDVAHDFGISIKAIELQQKVIEMMQAQLQQMEKLKKDKEKESEKKYQELTEHYEKIKNYVEVMQALEEERKKQLGVAYKGLDDYIKANLQKVKRNVADGYKPPNFGGSLEQPPAYKPAEDEWKNLLSDFDKLKIY